MARSIATATTVDLTELLDFVRPRHRWVLSTVRGSGLPHLSPVTGGVSSAERLVVSTYPERAKSLNLRARPQATVCVLSDDFGGPYVQVDGRATVVDMPDAEDGLVEYYRCISGEHPDWDEYRRAMRHQGKSLIEIDIDDWGPIATGGFPPRLAT